MTQNFTGRIDLDTLAIKQGDIVTIRKGVMVHTHKGIKPAGRTFKVKIYRFDNGYVMPTEEVEYRKRHGKDVTQTVFNPHIVWPGSGGYWCWVDLNDVPEAVLKVSDPIPALF